MITLTTDTVTVKIHGITGDIEAKIDTGAEQTSLHAEKIDVQADVVTFQLNDRIYRAQLENTQTVTSADGGEQQRPVIETSIEIEGQTVNTLINLNDRSGMPQQMLIGQDVIRSAGIALQLQPEGEDGAAGGDQPQSDTGSSPVDPNSSYQPDAPVAAPNEKAPTCNIELAKQALHLVAGLTRVQSELTNLQSELYELIRVINTKRG